MPEYAGIIYLCRNRANGKMYVGQTRRTLEKRMWFHLSDSRKGSLCRIHVALRECGREGFDVYPIAQCASIQELNLAEKFWIKKLHTLFPSGYNQTPGGNGAPTSDQKRAILSAAHKGVKQSEEHIRKRFESRKGWKHSEETKKRLSQMNTKPKVEVPEKPKGPRVRSAETKARLSESLKKSFAVNPRRPWTEEERAKLSKQKKGVKFSEEHKEKISASLKGVPRPWARYKRSEETKAKISAYQKGRPKPWLIGNKHEIIPSGDTNV